ncbi:tRNA-specific 2-thiouridylase [Melia azedarach]|uniref:tRNA-specific 2-thiouridylase n=1 Tax=Melia azedarach TaxID=155640 RepID=A0ACC1YED6_MELAZ|nr:tRNA-specific 2-thiouridylase [Melia azedarach]
MLHMGFQDSVARRGMRWQYERLEDKKGPRPPKSRKYCWGKKMKGFRLSPRSRKLTLKALSVVVMASKIIRMYADIIERMKMDGLCPSVVFSNQWGLPVLSHPSTKCKRSTLVC